MKIAVLSGKGGTGKTLISVNLAATAKESIYLDCDVEEPNGHLFFKPTNIKTKDISVKIPVVDPDLCNGCRICVDFCRFNALGFVNNKVIVFDEMCHSCGGCALLCPKNAISEKDKVIGKIETGKSENVSISTGILNTGEASGVPIIERLLKDNKISDKPIFIDCPPGSACVVMESIKDADYCILVAEPTLFGVSNLEMVYELVKLFNKPFGVVINKVLEDQNPAKQFCIDNNIFILSEILFDNSLGEINSNGKIAVRESIKYKNIFKDLLTTVEQVIKDEAIINS